MLVKVWLHKRIPPAPLLTVADRADRVLRLSLYKQAKIYDPHASTSREAGAEECAMHEPCPHELRIPPAELQGRVD
jgi:hypothetical protein